MTKQERKDQLNARIARLLFDDVVEDYISRPEYVIWKAGEKIRNSFNFYYISLDCGVFKIRLEPLRADGNVDRDNIIFKYTRLVGGQENYQICSLIAGVFEKYQKYVLRKAL